EPMAGDVDDVVDASGDPIIAVGVAPAAVAGEILAGIGLEIGVDEALVVAEYGAHLSGPAVGDAQIARSRSLDHLAVGIDDLRDAAEDGQRCRPGLKPDRARQRRDQDSAGFGLPPGVDDRAAAVSAPAVIPLPGFRIDRLADRSEQSQRCARGLLPRGVARL